MIVRDRNSYIQYAINWGNLRFFFAFVWPKPWEIIWYKDAWPRIGLIKFPKSGSGLEEKK